MSADAVQASSGERPRDVRLKWPALAVALVSVGLNIPTLILDANFGQLDRFFLASVITVVAFGGIGGLIAFRRPGHRMGWLLLFVAFTQALTAMARPYADYGVIRHPGSLPAAGFFAWINVWLWMPGLGVMATFLLLLFPDGHLPSPRWRLVGWVAAAMLMVATLTNAFGNLSRPARELATLSGDQWPPGIWAEVGHVALLSLGICMLASIASLFARYRSADSVTRHQLRWITYAAFLLGAAIAVSFQPFGLNGLVQSVGIAAGIAVFAAAIAVSVLRYRLYEIDVVISRTLVYGALAAFITAVYVGIVVGIGTLVGSGGRPSLMLSIAATAIVAVAFQPVRERLQKISNRLVYGKRATPYEVLSQFSERVAETYAGDEALPTMARVLAEGTGADRAEVWVRSGQLMRPAASWPEPNGVSLAQEPVAVPGQLLPKLPGEHAVPVRHQGELLGALTVSKRAGEAMTPIEEKLLDDLAHQAGLVLKNVGLTSELLARLDDLRASRQRLVAAQDEERRRLERNLHDGAQQNLVALKVKLGLAEAFADRDPEKALTLLAEIKSDADEALKTLRDLARGIYPPLLADKGLVAALEGQARKATLAVEVIAVGVERYPRDIEAAIYFCVLEALQNVQKYAAASRATVQLLVNDGSLAFEVEDDGAGFDSATARRGAGLTNMADRMDALGGSFAVTSEPGEGTRVAGAVPTPVLEPVP